MMTQHIRVSMQNKGDQTFGGPTFAENRKLHLHLKIKENAENETIWFNHSQKS